MAKLAFDSFRICACTAWNFLPISLSWFGQPEHPRTGYQKLEIAVPELTK
jgi:hypothetical protein